MRWLPLILALLAPATAVADEASRERAMELFENGATLYSEGLYAESIEAFERSYELSGEPALFFNIANAHERLGDPKSAVDALNRYRVHSTPDERVVLERRIENLERRVEEQRRADLRLAADAAAMEKARQEQFAAQRAVTPIVLPAVTRPVWAAPPPAPVATVQVVRRTRWLAVLGAGLAAAGGTAAGLTYLHSDSLKEDGNQQGWEQNRKVNGAGLVVTGLGLVTFGVGVALPVRKNRSRSAARSRYGGM